MALTGSLTVVGVGIRHGLQTTPEARAAIERAEKVLYLLADPLPGTWIEGLNPSAQSLAGFYADGKPRSQTYAEIVEEILAWVRKGLDVCVALYGHPGVFAVPGHAAIRTAREEGFAARMLPGISAEGCLFADLGVDPGDGCQSYEATDFLIHPPSFDPGVSLILWQVAAIGRHVGRTEPSGEGLAALAQRLADRYGPDHEVILYEAPSYPIGGPWVLPVRLSALAESELRPMATLYVPPKDRRPADEPMLRRLDIRADDPYWRSARVGRYARLAAWRRPNRYTGGASTRTI